CRPRSFPLSTYTSALRATTAHTSLSSFSLQSSAHPRALPSFPTRRSSDLLADDRQGRAVVRRARAAGHAVEHRGAGLARVAACADRKSTRLNSSHRTISYAVFCLKKKSLANGGCGPPVRARSCCGAP